MAKIKLAGGRRGYAFVKELGGAPARQALSKTASVLAQQRLIRGRVLDYGCGEGFDADSQGWDAFDPYYRTSQPSGLYDTIIVNHVANILTRASREDLFRVVDELLAEGGVAYVSVARNIPTEGKHGPRRRLQNYVVLTLPSVHCDAEEEVYALAKDASFADKTREFEESL
jgi:hypothetical protein